MTEEEKKPEAEAGDTKSAEDTTQTAQNTPPPANVTKPAPAETKPEPAVAVPQSAPVKRSGGLVAWFALLVSLAALAASGWLYQQSQIVAEQEAGEAQEALQMARRTGELLKSELQSLESTTQRNLESQLQGLQQRQQEQIQVLQSALQNQRRQLLELRSTDRSDWSLAEAEYLVRLAHQRLLMAGDVESALALLSSADAILLELDDADLLPVRAAFAQDIAALRGVGQVDVEGTWLRIRALAGEVDRLLLFQLPQPVAEAQPAPADASWNQKLEHGLRAAANKLSSYIIIRRRDAAYEPLMDPQWERLVRQNLRMLLEQTQTALLSGNQLLYQQSIMACRRWVGEFFAFNEAAVAALDTELGELAQLEITRDYPDINDSLAAVKTAINLRHADAAGDS